MSNEENTRKVKMSHLREFTVLFKNSDTLRSKSADMTVHTFVCAAVDESDAVRQLRMSRSYSVEMLDKRFKSAHMRKSFRVRKFKVVKVYSGDGVGHCTCKMCEVGRTDSRKIMVVPSKMPRWMMKNYFGKGK